MPLTLSLQFPAGRYVAAAWGNRDEVEWPPHPARLCLGLVDVLHKSGNPTAEREALLWLIQQGPPVVVIPSFKQADIQVLDGIYVPQNPSVAASVKHPRKPRSFPTVFLYSDAPTIFFYWPDAELPEQLQESLGGLISAMPRFGHSSSMVNAAICDVGPPDGDDWRVIRPLEVNEPATPEFRLRVNWRGLLESAESHYDAEGRAKEMEQLIAAAAPSARPDKPLKPVASPRGRHDPRHRWHGYVEEGTRPLSGTPWDKRILVLSQIGGDRLGLSATWQVTDVFHKALLDRWDRKPSAVPIPFWLSGHRPGESDTATAAVAAHHLSVFPLAFVGACQATGHLLGLGIALPKPESISIDSATLRLEWRNALSSLLGKNGELELSPPDNAWTIRLAPDESLDPKLTLRPTRWTRPATTWTTVTPIILDRHPKPDFERDPEAWRASCVAIIAEACTRLGLPVPVRVNVSPHSTLPGVPAAFAFAPPAARAGRPQRFHIHASIQFAEAIEGPLLLGAGRFRGYGLCLPLDPIFTNRSDAAIS